MGGRHRNDDQGYPYPDQPNSGRQHPDLDYTGPNTGPIQADQPYGSGRPYTGDPAYGSDGTYGSNQPYGADGNYGLDRSYGADPAYGGTDPAYGSDNTYGSGQTYGSSQPYGSDHQGPYGAHQPYGTNQPYGTDQPYGSNQPYGSDQAYGSERPHGSEPSGPAGGAYYDDQFSREYGTPQQDRPQYDAGFNESTGEYRIASPDERYDEPTIHPAYRVPIETGQGPDPARGYEPAPVRDRTGEHPPVGRTEPAGEEPERRYAFLGEREDGPRGGDDYEDEPRSGRSRGRRADGDTDPGDRGRSRRTKRSGGGAKILVALTSAVALAVLLAVAAYVLVADETGCPEGSPIALKVTTSPDIRPAVAEIAEKFNKPGCYAVTVGKVDSSRVVSGLAGASETLTADVWIPDSSLWAARLAASAKSKAISSVIASSPSIASSPIVMATAKSAADALAERLPEPGWAKLMELVHSFGATESTQIRLLTPDPARNAAGLGAIVAGAGALGDTPGAQEQLAGVLKQLSQSSVQSAEKLFSTFGKPSKRAPLGLVSERDVWAFNQSKPADPAVALYPSDGTLSLDYPYVVAAEDPAKKKAAEAFRAKLVGAEGRGILQKAGFRTADGKAGEAVAKSAGIDTKPLGAIGKPSAGTVNKIAQAWSRLNLGTRMLALLDVSGTMALPVPGTNLTRMQAIAGTAVEGMKRFNDKSEIGVWEFSTHLDGQGVDHREFVKVGPLGGKVEGMTRREFINQRLGQIQAKQNGDTGLNDTLAAAYEEMVAGYQPDKINTILVLTDGQGNDDPGGGLTDEQLLKKLKAQFDKSRPVSILIIAFGQDAVAGKERMAAIAQATNGDAYVATDIKQVAQFFLEGISRRLCAPNCPKPSTTTPASTNQ
ncbi:substrate-binding domain-containing protein [Rhizohabitans arisaemae]|uniref:substrate-binding domain-containing protein n=1 Tax=Rhizohabitans arisaemae TaxID=2720610 RepID=UPI0024B1A778|nr:substrate-binding domain-containing protein [Rhizohabitans arisaemae]